MLIKFIIAIIIILVILSFYKSNTNKNVEICMINTNEKFPNVPMHIKEKFCKIFTDDKIMDKLSKEPPIGDRSTRIYPNKLIQMIDGSMIGLGMYEEGIIKQPQSKKMYENMLYELEKEYDKILQ